MINIVSDFTDYYDRCIDDKSKIVYTRKRELYGDRGKELKFLKSLDINTINIGNYRMFSRRIDKFVVYTEPSKHDSLGKHIYTYGDVESQYRNYIVADFIEGYVGYTVKYLQIGERRYRLMLFNPDYKEKLTEGSVVAIEELPRQYNYAIGLPIFSIDYISDGMEMIAIDFNEVQRLDKLGMESIIKAEDVVIEVKKALLAYQKA